MATTTPVMNELEALLIGFAVGERKRASISRLFELVPATPQDDQALPLRAVLNLAPH